MILRIEFRDRIDTAGMPWMTTPQTFHSQPHTTHSTKALDSFNHVLRTAGLEATVHAQKWAQQEAVEANKCDQDFCHCVTTVNQCRSRADQICVSSRRASPGRDNTTISILLKAD